MSGNIQVDQKKSLTLAAFYRPPNKTDEHYRIQAKKEIDTLQARQKKNVFLTGGDFNLPDIDWKDLSIKGSQYPPKTNQTFLDIIANNSLEQIIDFPTRNDTTLDLI